MLNNVVLSATANLVITPEFLRKCWLYAIAGAPGEVSGWGEVVEQEHTKGCLVIPDVLHIIDQDGTCGATCLDDNAAAELCGRYARAGRLDTLCLWYHTHGHIGAFFSSHDEATLDRLAASMPRVVGVVATANGQMLVRLREGSLQCTWSVDCSALELPTHAHAELQAARALVRQKRRRSPVWSRWFGRKEFGIQGRWAQRLEQCTLEWGAKEWYE